MDKILCVGKNYLKHAQELGDAVPEEPLFFIKPPSTVRILDVANGDIPLPHDHGPVHHEVELVFKIGRRDERWVFTHYTIGLDLTLRDVQTGLKKAGQPWEKSKVFANSCLLGVWQPMNGMKELLDQTFELYVNGERRQAGVGRDMRWKPDELLQEAAKWFPISDGDLLFTGTPEGVGPLEPGDRAEVRSAQIHYSFTVGV